MMKIQYLMVFGLVSLTFGYERLAQLLLYTFYVTTILFFPADAGYFYFSADFRLKRFLWLFLHYRLVSGWCYSSFRTSLLITYFSLHNLFIYLYIFARSETVLLSRDPQ